MNPYKVLNIDHIASKQEIIKAVTVAMRERKFSGMELAKAQQELLNPNSKAICDFLHFIDMKPLLEQTKIKIPKKQSMPDLHHLSIFDEVL